ncbi:hypothetical protein QZH41_007273 [Actinostola sp. cb2023]|nr:hypothetical protein QZH41_007273 [Actinostola sp. cb2023]
MSSLAAKLRSKDRKKDLIRLLEEVIQHLIARVVKTDLNEGMSYKREHLIQVDVITIRMKITPILSRSPQTWNSIQYKHAHVVSKGAGYTIKSLTEAFSLVRQCKELLEKSTDHIRVTTGITGTINGPQVYVSARTVASVGLLEWGLKRLNHNLSPFAYNATNLLSCMTLDVENCQVTVHTKQANMSMAEYARSFGITMKESVKRITKWAAHYHTSRKSWYPKPEETVPFWEVPTIQLLPIVHMTKPDCDALRDWASSYGAAVRQCTVRQETTMAKHGTLPEYMYQRQCITSDSPIRIIFEKEISEVEVEVEENPAEISEDINEQAESEDQYDESSDESESNVKQKLEAPQRFYWALHHALGELSNSIIDFCLEGKKKEGLGLEDVGEEVFGEASPAMCLEMSERHSEKQRQSNSVVKEREN